MSRREQFELTRPDGVVVVIDRDLDTGEQTATVKAGIEPEGIPIVVRRRTKPPTTTTK